MGSENQSPSENITRRSVLASIGASALASGTAAAAGSPTSDAPAEYDVVTDESTRRRVVASAISSSEFRRLRRYFVEQGDASLSVEDSTVVHAQAADSNTASVSDFYVVEVPFDSIEVDGRSDNDTAGISIAVGSGEVLAAAASVRWSYTDRETLTQIKNYRLENGEVTVNTESVTRKQVRSAGNRDGYSVNASLECDACKAAYAAAAAIGCTATVSTICIAASLPTGGTAAALCSLVVTALCGAAGQFDYFTGYSAYELCSGKALGGPAKDWAYCS